jgi:hypothetical protein
MPTSRKCGETWGNQNFIWEIQCSELARLPDPYHFDDENGEDGQRP